MPTQYVSKKEQVRDYIEHNFFSGNEEHRLVEAPLTDLYFACFKQYGADKKTVDGVIELYEEAGLLRRDKNKVMIRDA